MYLAVAIESSNLTFFGWPLYCESETMHYFETVIGKENLEGDWSVGEEAFVAACERDKHFFNNVRVGIKAPAGLCARESNLAQLMQKN